MFGWRVEVTADGGSVVLDEHGVERARVERSQLGGRPVTRPWVREGATVEVHLPGGTTRLVNGTPHAWRRRGKHGRWEVEGRTYRYLHDGRRDTRLLRDERLLARLRRTGFRDASPVAVDLVPGPLDHVDALAVVLGQECVRAGRDGLVGAVLLALPS